MFLFLLFSICVSIFSLACFTFFEFLYCLLLVCSISFFTFFFLFFFFCYWSNSGLCYDTVLQDKLYTPTVKKVKSYFLTVFISEKMLILSLDYGFFMHLGEISYNILLIISHRMIWKNVQNTKDSVLAIAFRGWHKFFFWSYSFGYTHANLNLHKHI